MRNTHFWTKKVEENFEKIHHTLLMMNSFSDQPKFNGKDFETDIYSKIKEVQLANAALHVLSGDMVSSKKEDKLGTIREYAELIFGGNDRLIRDIKEYLLMWGFKETEGEIYVYDKIEEFNALPIEMHTYMLHMHHLYMEMKQNMKYLHIILLEIQKYEAQMTNMQKK